MDKIEKKVLAELLDKQLNGFIIVNDKKQVMYANKMVRDLFGNEVHRLLGNYLKCTFTLLEKVDCQTTSNCKSCLVKNAIEKTNNTKETQVLKDIEFSTNGKNLTFSIKICSIDDYISLELFNIGQSYERLHFLSSLFEKSEDLMLFKEKDLSYKYINKSAERFFGVPIEQIINKKDEDLMEEELVNHCKRGDLITLSEGKYSDIETFGDITFRVSKEYINGGILCIAKDITEEIKATKMAEIDSLTKLYNRRKFTNMIDKIYKYKEDGYYLALIDLDDLRVLNNEYGHSKGDKYLVNLASVLMSYSDGLFFRIGGDEFAALIYKEKEDIKSMFDSIFNELNSLNFEPNLSISVGIKKMDLNHSYLYNYDQVDKLLYEVKQNGKNGFMIV